ncbi:hypothetical protein BJ742DRAFT_549333 [Cladochytrium replicatum]|nr:hypothetical protein BJ742DRAFT_549333 [Cladochytrium replicatum]
MNFLLLFSVEIFKVISFLFNLMYSINACSQECGFVEGICESLDRDCFLASFVYIPILSFFVFLRSGCFQDVKPTCFSNLFLLRNLMSSEWSTR